MSGLGFFLFEEDYNYCDDYLDEGQDDDTDTDSDFADCDRHESLSAAERNSSMCSQRLY